MRRILNIIIAVLLTLSYSPNSLAQVETDTTTTTKRKRVPNLMQEIANLTRTPLGEGDLRLKLWMQYTIEERGGTRSGRVYFSENDPAIAWIDNLSRPKSFFYRASPDSPIVTVVPSIKQGTQLSENMMVAMGFISEEIDPIEYTVNKDAATLDILGRECEGAVYSDASKPMTMWYCGKSEFKREERDVVWRGVGVWARNQTTIEPIKSALIEEGQFVLGFDKADYKFRVLDWGMDGDFVIALDEIMVNVPGRDLNQVAKEYVEDLERQKED
jgi:hypothetical protein